MGIQVFRAAHQYRRAPVEVQTTPHHARAEACAKLRFPSSEID